MSVRTISPVHASGATDASVFQVVIDDDGKRMRHWRFYSSRALAEQACEVLRKNGRAARVVELPLEPEAA